MKIGARTVTGFLDAAQVQDDEEDDGARCRRGSCSGCQAGGKKLKMASPQETIETVIVSM